MAGLQSAPLIVVIRAVIGIVIGIVIGLLSRQAAGAEVFFAGPRSCSRAAELEARVEGALGQPLEGLADVRCSVHVVRDGGAYVARLEVSGAGLLRSLQRSFSAKTCPKLMDRLELALMLELGGWRRSAAPARGASVQPALFPIVSAQRVRAAPDARGARAAPEPPSVDGPPRTTAAPATSDDGSSP